MKKCYLAVIASLLMTSLMGQELVATIPLKYSYIKNVQGQALGDSLFIVYNDTDGDLTVFKSMFVMPDGSQKNIDLRELRARMFLGTINTIDSVYFYYLEEQKKSVEVRAVVYDKNLENKSKPSWRLKLPEKILASYNDGNLSIVYAQDDRTVSHIQVKRLSVVAKFDYPLPLPFFDKKSRSISFIPENDNDISPKEAEAGTKLYLKDNKLLIGSDETNVYSQTPPGKTTIIQIDSVGYDSGFILDKSGKSFSTFVHNDLVYKVIKNYGFQITVSDMKGKLISDFTIDKQSPFGKEIAYVRDDNAKRVFNNRTVWDAMDNSGQPFISVHSLDSGKLVLTVGTHSFIKRGLPIPIIGGLGTVIALATATARIATIAADKGVDGLDHYFYLTGTPQEGFTYTNASQLRSQAVDVYELFNKDNPVHYRYKGHLSNQNRTFCIYQLIRGANEVRIVKFQ